MVDSGLGRAWSEGRLEALFEAAVARALAGGRLLVPLVLACECPVTTANQVVTRALSDSEASALGLQAVTGEPLSAATCDALCEAPFGKSGPVVSCRVVRTHAPGEADASAPDAEAPADVAGGDVGASPVASSDSSPHLECIVPVTTDCGGVGRWTAGARLASRPINAAASYFGDAAGFERVAVTAFIELERDLDRLGAPLTLRQRARRARTDEVRHARIMAAEGARLHAHPRPCSVASRSPRSLIDVALENAVYGCVEETWGAILLLAQSEQAAEPRMRRLFRRIGREELSHATLAWDLHRWACTRLQPHERRRVEEALQAATAARVAAKPPSLAPGLARYVGLAKAG